LFNSLMKTMSPLYEASASSPILNSCNRLFHQYLKVVDSTLYQHMQSLDIEPQLFGL
jgi:hypothetical protein